jgi:hypothetical protein
MTTAPLTSNAWLKLGLLAALCGNAFLLGRMSSAEPASEATPEPVLVTGRPPGPKPEAPSTPGQQHPVPPEKHLSGNGFPLFVEAVKRMPKQPNPTARHEFEAMVINPANQLSPVGLKYARDCWPAVELFEKAMCCDGFARIGSASSLGFDLAHIQDLCVAALGVARIQSATRAAPTVGRWSLRVIRLGQSLADSVPLIEEAGALSLVRLGERWLKDALESRPWSEDELAWLRERLDALEPGRSTLDPSRIKDQSPAVEGFKKALAQEKDAWAEVRRLANTTKPGKG